jgi:hypothetical protein
MRERRISGLAGQTQSFSQGKRTSVLSVASVLSAIVYALIGLTLALRPGDAAAVALMATLVTCVLFALLDGFVAAVGHVALLLRPIVVVPARHEVCSGGRICAPVPSTPSLRSLERS